MGLEWKNKTKISIVGFGHLGLSLTLLLASCNKVIVLEMEAMSAYAANSSRSTTPVDQIATFSAEKYFDISAILYKQTAYKGASSMAMPASTNLHPDTNRFDTGSTVLAMSDALNPNTGALAMVELTIPVTHKNSAYQKYTMEPIFFSFRALATRAGVEG